MRLQKLVEYLQTILTVLNLIENLKINLNILEACLGNSEIKVINLEVVIYHFAENPINEDSFMKGELEPTNSHMQWQRLQLLKWVDQ